MLHAYLGSMLSLFVSAAESSDQSGCGHGAGYANFALASNLCAGDGSILFVKNANNARRQQKAFDSFFRGSLAEILVIVKHSGNNSSGAIGRSRNYLSARGVFFVNGNGIDIHPTHDIQRIV